MMLDKDCDGIVGGVVGYKEGVQLHLCYMYGSPKAPNYINICV